MRRNNGQLKLIAHKRGRANLLRNRSGNPDESYRWSHMASILGDWKQFFRPKVYPLELTEAEIVRIEAGVRKALYP